MPIIILNGLHEPTHWHTVDWHTDVALYECYICVTRLHLCVCCFFVLQVVPLVRLGSLGHRHMPNGRMCHMHGFWSDFSGMIFQQSRCSFQICLKKVKVKLVKLGLNMRRFFFFLTLNKLFFVLATFNNVFHTHS